MKCIFSEFNKPFITHFSKFLGKCWTVNIKIIGKLLAVEWNYEFLTASFSWLIGQIYKKPFSDCLRWCAEYPVRQGEILLNGNVQQIVKDCIFAVRIFKLWTHQFIYIKKKNHTCFRSDRIYHERFASQSICFSEYMSRRNIAHNSFVAPQIYIFNSYLTRCNNSNFVNAVCYMIYKRIFAEFSGTQKSGCGHFWYFRFVDIFKYWWFDNCHKFSLYCPGKIQFSDLKYIFNKFSKMWLKQHIYYAHYIIL